MSRRRPPKLTGGFESAVQDEAMAAQRKRQKLVTAFCDVCGRERPTRALSLAWAFRYCNDNHNDTRCHEQLALLARLAMAEATLRPFAGPPDRRQYDVSYKAFEKARAYFEEFCR